MLIYEPIKITVAASRELDNLRAEVARNKANNDYIAMMCDVELAEHSEDGEEAI